MKHLNKTKKLFLLALLAFLCFNWNDSKARPYYIQAQAQSYINSIYASGAEVWACTRGGLLYNNSNGTGGWIKNVGGLYHLGLNPNCFVKVGTSTNYIVGLLYTTSGVYSSPGGVYFSGDAGVTWNNSNMPTNITVKCFAINVAGDIFAGTSNGIWKSINNGATWSQQTTTNGYVVNCILKTPSPYNELYVGTSQHIYKFVADNVWLQWDGGILPSYPGYSITSLTCNFDGTIIYAGTDLNIDGYSPAQVFRSSGAAWVRLDPQQIIWNTGFTSLFRYKSGPKLVVGNSETTIVSTTNDGATWKTDDLNLMCYEVSCLAEGTTNLYAGTHGGFYYSAKNPNTLDWQTVEWDFAAVGHPWIYNFNTMYTTIKNNGFLSTTNGGTTWSTHNSGLDSSSVINMIHHDAGILVSTHSGLYRSSNTGNSWQYSGLSDSSIINFAASGSNLYAVSRNTGFYKSTNAGISWLSSNSGLSNLKLRSIALKGGQLFVCGKGGIYKSSNQGATWIISSVADTNAFSFASDNSMLYCTGRNLNYSSNNGVTWNSSPLSFYSSVMESNDVVNNLAAKNGKIYIASTSLDSGLYISSNNGVSWSNSSKGWASKRFTSVVIDSNTIYLGDRVGGISRIALSEITGIKQISNIIPESISLYQNYPNPFNPTTNIKFDLKNGSKVKITIYNIIGKEAAVLVNQVLNAGSYNYSWDATAFPSGVYFYKLEADNFNETKRMVLIK